VYMLANMFRVSLGLSYTFRHWSKQASEYGKTVF
jgi:hypothetical protein